MSLPAVYQVEIAGQDISSSLAPLLISLDISDREGTNSDTCRLAINDQAQAIRFPRTGDPMNVALGRAGGGVSVVFQGTVDEVKSSGSRGGGRILSISGKGVDTQGKAKEAQQLHIDDADVKTALQKVGERAGITDIKVDQKLAAIKRPWWGVNDESFLQFGERTAREVGGIFKVRGKQAILAAKTGSAVSGEPMPVITAEWGVNLLSWDITPQLGLPRHKKVRARFYDRKEAKWKEVEAEVENEDADATFGEAASLADGDEAEATAQSRAKDAEKQKGGGSVEIDGTAAAKPGGTCIIIGARPGIDGTYRIESVDHSYSRSGWVTRLELKQPQGDAGKDNRPGPGKEEAPAEDDDFALPTDPDLG